MAATPEYYEAIVEAFGDLESMTVLVVAGRSRDEVAQVLRVDLTSPVADPWEGEGETTGWALVDVPSGVLASEPTGYGDPTRAALVELSAGGGAAAVVRSNIQAHLRFGCAKDGQLLFDDDEFIYSEAAEAVPAELRPLFDLVWEDLDEEDEEDEDGPDPFAVGLAMAEVVTGIELSAGQVAGLERATLYAAPGLVYARALDD